MRPTRVLAYCRVSTDEQERSGTSLQGQREEIARHCTAVGWPAPRFWVETESGGEEKLAKRVQLRALLNEARSGDLVVVTKQDRWARDTLFFLQSVRDLTAREVGFFSLAERFDTSTPEGKMAATMSAAFAEQERARIIQRTVDRRRSLRDQGCWTEGVAPLGYVRNQTTRRLEVHEKDAEIVRLIFELCIRGMGIEPIARELRDRGLAREGATVRLWDRKSVGSILDARWYLGEIRHADGTWHAAHPPIISPTSFDAAKKAREGRSLGGSPGAKNARSQAWLLRGIAACGRCGSRIGTSYGGDGYYRCGGRNRHACVEPYARVVDVDADVARLALGRLEALRGRLAKAGSAEPNKAGGIATELAASLAAARQRRQRAVSLAVDGLLTKDDLRARVERIDGDIARIEERLRETERAGKLRDPKVRAEAFAVVKRIREAWDRVTVAVRREILVCLAERITMQGGRVACAWRSEAALVEATGMEILKPGAVRRRKAGAIASGPRRGRS